MLKTFRNVYISVAYDGEFMVIGGPDGMKDQLVGSTSEHLDTIKDLPNEVGVYKCILTILDSTSQADPRYQLKEFIPIMRLMS